MISILHVDMPFIHIFHSNGTMVRLWQSQFCLKPPKTRARTSLSVWCHHSSLRKDTLLSQIHCIIFVFHAVGWYRGLWLAQAVLAWESWDQLRHQLELANSNAEIEKGGEKKPLYVMSEIMTVSSWFKNALGEKRSHYDWWRKKKRGFGHTVGLRTND